MKEPPLPEFEHLHRNYYKSDILFGNKEQTKSSPTIIKSY